MMIPFEASIIPNFENIRGMDLIDTYPGLALPFLATAFGTFLLRQTFKQIPKELKEASEIAGIGHFKYYLTVVLPIAKTSLVTLAIYSFLFLLGRTYSMAAFINNKLVRYAPFKLD